MFRHAPVFGRLLMNEDERKERFIRRLTDHQSGLFAYVVALIGDVNEAHNVLQETNLVLWRRSADFGEGTDFGAWSRKIAHFQVLAYRRDRQRDRHLFDDALLTQLAERPRPADDDEARRLALRHCLADLPDDLRQLISLRYAAGSSIKEMTRLLGKTEGALKVMLSRVRQRLMHCIEHKLSAGGL